MRIRYSWLWTRISKHSKQLMVAAGLLVVPFTIRFEKPATAKPVRATPNATPVPKPILVPAVVDPRTAKLKSFFCRLHCPITELSEEFVHAADDNRLDWRLLPSISVVESGGGKAFRNNNIFGWSNGLQLFPTIRSGIHEVAFKLGKSPLYQNRDSKGKLMVYNPNEDYAQQVMTVMTQISPVVNLRPVRLAPRRRPQLAYVEN